jgi:rhamnosyltransferase
MKNIFIIGSQGYDKNYGGWETFVKNLCDFYDKSKANLFVSELTFDKNKKMYKKNNVNCLPIYTSKLGNATMFLNALLAFNYVKKYIKKNKIENAIIYILGLRLGPILGFSKFYLRKNNIKVYVNPDGLEWKRSKWNKFIKFCFKYSEMTMTKHCDGIVCDSKGIKTYLEEEYPKNKVKKHFIAYGTKIVNLR